MSDHRFSIKKIFQRRETQTVFKSVRVTSQVVWNLFLIFTIIGTMSLLFVGGAGAGYFISLVKDEPVRSYEDMRRDIYDYEEATEIYFAGNDYLGDLPSPLERREIPLEEMSEHVINAVIATEDEYFEEHNGIVPKALLRAIYQDFSNASTQTGGSTLTQQLIKNQILTSEVTHDRKAVEILLAIRLEQFFEKDEILEAYLNVVPFGRNASGRQIAGVQAAAQGIFGVDAKDLNIPQAAFIAGLPQSPFAYTPFTSRQQGEAQVKENMDAGLNRMRTVLNRMHSRGYITDEQYEEALAYDIRANLAEPQPSSLDDYPYVTDYVRSRATDALAIALLEADGIILEDIDDENQRDLLRQRYREEAQRSLHRDGYKIHTTIDRELYDAHQKAVADYSDSFASSVSGTRTNEQGEVEAREFLEEAGSMLIENGTGRILSFVGGRDYEQENYNHATQAERQTGSTIKPLYTYALGLDTGVIQPGMITPDVTYFYPPPNDSTQVRNFDRDHRGLITARTALALSRNVPAVREAEKIPHDLRRETLVNLGFEKFFPNDSSFPHPSTALGTLEMTVEANTAAYATFGNEGQYLEGYVIERIENSAGEVIYEHEPDPVEVFSPQTSYLMIDMMREVLRSGTATRIPGYLSFQADWAGKTGTATNDEGHARDYWFVGLNPNVTLSAWIGYGNGHRLANDYSPRLQRLWANMANELYEVNPELIGPSDQFQSPGGIVSQSICGISGMLPSDLCREAGFVTTDLFNAKYVPTEVDDSLERVNYVSIDGDLYRALESTPLEFTNEGISVKEEYFDFGEDVNVASFMPESWSSLIPDREAPDNGKTPDPLSSLSVSSNRISWNNHHEEDVIGYRIYYSIDEGTDFTLVDSVKWDEEFTYSGHDGAYYVTAVDVAGRESSQSDVVIIGEYINPEDEEPSEPEPEPEPEEDERRRPEREQDNATKPEDDEDENNSEGNEHDSNNGNGNGNGNGNRNRNNNG
ncbi:transglycosylase domain-containing protein [Evansella cellulosilytica]|uniref:Peptidoglycan glycosyltransferase n=1 Tax=Evansella cellulosilytica (strain ATCC 21833 / DSM 2522 / FERM P-1141 / JCM 9156 / N-4) TaxID=649639 RepID=E6U162_EVAC2|nr:transglycosylase domain-containing protein [Evansella cellulosilytica]ADU31508.1 Peptidoglycan glycosyltransferase [Evansella cellulosilytica DSM 2522]